MLSLDVWERTQAWAYHDPNPTTVQYVQDLMNLSREQQQLQEQQQCDGNMCCDERLSNLFPSNRLQFGTGGLRARMQPGPMGMNDLVVVQTAQGLARYVIKEYAATTSSYAEVPQDTASHDQCQTLEHSDICAVVGYDHRSSVDEPFDVSSLSFAIFTALVFMEAGIDCFLLDGFVPTPIVSYGVLRYVPEQMMAAQQAQCEIPNVEQMHASVTRPPTTTIGVMITASHNPAHDAGYKVFWTDGCQIRSPIDQGIAASIEENLIPWTNYQKLYEQRRAQFPNDPCVGLSRPKETEQLVSAYYQSILQSGLVTTATSSKERDCSSLSSNSGPKFAYSAMHGVGHKFVQQGFQRFGLPPLLSIPEQQEPDPQFPTVSFPNPEETGALEMAKIFALDNNCTIVLANDPDADRLGVSEYDAKTGKWTDFTGDQIGLMFGHWLWTQFRSKDEKGEVLKCNGNTQGTTSTTAESKKALPISMCSSTVSSQVLANMARREGFHHEETLPGFKWIGSKAAELGKSGKFRQVFCYEEAIGFCCGDVVFDKDGITACLVLVKLANHVHEEQGQSLAQHLQSLYKRYGEFVSNNGYFILDNPSTIPLIMDHITQGGTYERTYIRGYRDDEDGRGGGGNGVSNRDESDSCLTYEIASIRYLGEPGFDSTTPDKKPLLSTSISSPMVTIRFTNGGVAQFRASGTEPKFKYYFELRGQPGVDRSTVEKELAKWSKSVLQELLPMSKFGLKQRQAVKRKQK